TRSSQRWRSGDELGEPAEVLGNRCKCELVLCAARATQPKATEPEDALQVGEQHLDALAVAARLLEGLGLSQRTSDIARIFIDAARDLARRLLGAASQLEWTYIANELARPVEQLVIIHDLARGRKDLALRACVDVAL